MVPPTAKERQKEYLKQELIKTLGVKRNAMTVPGEISRQVCASKVGALHPHTHTHTHTRADMHLPLPLSLCVRDP